MAAQPSTKPSPTVKERVTLIPSFKVLLHNDDVNSMQHVVSVLKRVFRINRQRAEEIMLEAHQKGIALCAVEPFETAELHRDQLISASLTATIEPE